MGTVESQSHKELNKSLDLFEFSDLVGKGIPILQKNGAILKRVLTDFLIKEENYRGYMHVETPPLGKKSLYETTGHYDKHSIDMYPSFDVDGTDYVMRSVTCPNHYAMFLSRDRTFKELPLRFTEMSTLIRKDQRGKLDGLFRTNTFTLNDSHIFCSKSNVEEEYLKIIDFIKFFNSKLGIESKITYRLSLSDFNNDKYLKQPELWEQAEKMLTNILKKANVEFFVSKDKACFYGPKLDVMMENYTGKSSIITTVQLDFILPYKFNAWFINENNEKERPIVIHRALPFSIERTIAFLTEFYQGVFPFWLSPVQVLILPVKPDANAYAEMIYKKMFANNIRVELDNSVLNFNKKIKKASNRNIPYIVIVGQDEQLNNSVTVKIRSGNQYSIKTTDFIEQLVKENQINSFYNV